MQQNTTPHPTPGLDRHQAAARERMVRQWMRRVMTVAQQTGCSIQQALAAIEHADKESQSHD